jgi:hypothetical protein
MTARLQAATSSGKPVLLRVDYQAGHDIGNTKEQREKETADQWSFLLWQSGVAGFQPLAAKEDGAAESTQVFKRKACGDMWKLDADGPSSPELADLHWFASLGRGLEHVLSRQA